MGFDVGYKIAKMFGLGGHPSKKNSRRNTTKLCGGRRR
jgi:hypothetical protein